MHVLNIRIDEVSKVEALARLRGFLGEQKLHRIFTPNPEILVAATRNPSFGAILNKADLSLCDGKGIELFAQGKLERIPGVDFMADILGLAEKEHKSVYLLGSGKTKTLTKLFAYIQKNYPNLHIAGMHPGPQFFIHKGVVTFKNTQEEEINQKVIREIQMNHPAILFVAFGHEKQETWIEQYSNELSGVQIAMGVGGSFEYISGSVKRAPFWLRKIGMEWLYRFFTQPKRFSRIINAILIFPYYAFIKNR